MAEANFLRRTDKTKLFADGTASFDVRPMLAFVQRLVDKKALRSDAEMADLLNPAEGSSEVDHWSLVGEVCAQCGEYPDAQACFAQALSADPNHVPTLERKVALLIEVGEPAEARAIKAQLEALNPSPAKAGARAAAQAAIDALDVAEWYETTEKPFFARGWRANPKLEKAFRTWAAKAFPGLAAQQTDLALLENLIVDEHAGAAIAAFLNSLPKARRADAVRCARQDIVFSLGGRKPSAAVKALLERLDATLQQLK